MKTLLAVMLIVMSVSPAFATEDVKDGSEQFCALDRTNTKANLDESSKEESEQTATSK